MPVSPLRELIMIDENEDIIVIADDDDCVMIDSASAPAAGDFAHPAPEADLEICNYDSLLQNQGSKTTILERNPSTASNCSNGSLSTSFPSYLSRSSSRKSLPSPMISSQSSRCSSASPSLHRSVMARRFGNAASPIDLRAEDSLETVSKEQNISGKTQAIDYDPHILSRSMKYQPGLDDILVEIEDDEEEAGVVSSTVKSSSSSERRRKSYPQRNPGIVAPYKLMDSIQANSGKQSFQLRPGKYVELTDGDFLHIQAIIGHLNKNEILLRGYRLQRCSAMNGMLEKKLNELCYFYELDLDDPRPLLEQCVNEVSLTEVKKIRNVRSTNQKFPLDRNVTTTDFQSQLEASLNGGLTVRWKYTCKYATASHRYRNEYCERTLEHIRANESQGTIASTDVERRFEWRGDTVLGGSYQPFRFRESNFQGSFQQEGIAINISHTSSWSNSHHDVNALKVIDLEALSVPVTPKHSMPINFGLATPPLSGSIRAGTRSSPSLSRIRGPGQMLTYGDAFCGTGGTTRGAIMAGLKVKWGFDINTHACASWRANFPDAEIYEVDSSTFVQLAQQNPDKLKMKVDILHLSPPCQFFSVAHSTIGKKDEENSATLFAVRDVIEIAKPRVVTLEQTFGIMRTQFMWYLAALIQMFTSLDFSLRWAVVPLADWGLPQSRKRLIMIASCPGEILPRMPAATHSRNGEGGLKRFVTVNQTLRQIHRDAPNHNVNDLREKNEPPWDGDSILPRAMTCSGGQNYHPSGKRDFTEREYAVLQGFPPTHVFKGSYIRKQIGNAVPPSVAKVLFESIKRDLNRADGIEEESETLFID